MTGVPNTSTAQSVNTRIKEPDMTTTEHPAVDAQELVERITTLQEQAEIIDLEIRGAKAQLAALGTGTHQVGHMRVTVSPPSRRFNIDTALTFISEEQRAMVLSPDAKKVKAFLPPVLLDQCMDEGTGNPIVKLS